MRRRSRPLHFTHPAPPTPFASYRQASGRRMTLPCVPTGTSSGSWQRAGRSSGTNLRMLKPRLVRAEASPRLGRTLRSDVLRFYQNQLSLCKETFSSSSVPPEKCGGIKMLGRSLDNMRHDNSQYDYSRPCCCRHWHQYPMLNCPNRQQKPLQNRLSQRSY